jgi:hypothetical protein
VLRDAGEAVAGFDKDVAVDICPGVVFARFEERGLELRVDEGIAEPRGEPVPGQPPTDIDPLARRAADILKELQPRQAAADRQDVVAEGRAVERNAPSARR